jgi:hypothetical protein
MSVNIIFLFTCARKGEDRNSNLQLISNSWIRDEMFSDIFYITAMSVTKFLLSVIQE